MTILVFVLSLLLYAAAAVLVIEVICLILGLFIAVPPKVKQLLYAIVGVILLIYIFQFVLSPGYVHITR